MKSVVTLSPASPPLASVYDMCGRGRGLHRESNRVSAWTSRSRNQNKLLCFPNYLAVVILLEQWETH